MLAHGEDKTRVFARTLLFITAISLIRKTWSSLPCERNVGVKSTLHLLWSTDHVHLNLFTGSVTSFIYNGTLSSFLVYSTSQPTSHTSSTPLLLIPYHTISTMSPSTRRPRPQGRVKKHKARSNSPRAFEILPVEVRSSIVFSTPGFRISTNSVH